MKPEASQLSKVQVIPNMPEAEYHAIKDRLSSSMIKKILQSPAHLKAYMSRAPEQTSAQAGGQRTHAAILEPRALKDRYAVEPNLGAHAGALVTGDDLKARCKELGLPVSGKKAELAARILDADPKAIIWDRVLEQFAAANPGKIAISEAEYKQMHEVVESVFASDAATHALQGESELTILWEDAATGIACKARIDKYNRKTGCLTDVKTTEDDASPEGFSRFVANWDVDVQIAFYSLAIQAAGLPFNDHRIVMAERKDPYGVGIYKLHPRAFNDGMKQVQTAMDCYAEAQKTGFWPGYADCCLIVDKPAYAYRETAAFEVVS